MANNSTIGASIKETIIVNGEVMNGLAKDSFILSSPEDDYKLHLGQDGAGLYAQNQTARQKDISMNCFINQKAYNTLFALKQGKITFSILYKKLLEDGSMTTISCEYCKVLKYEQFTSSATGEEGMVVVKFNIKAGTSTEIIG